MSEPVEYPAIMIVHWPGKDVAACLHHAAQIIKLGQSMGFSLSATPVKADAELICQNCANEARRKANP